MRAALWMLAAALGAPCALANTLADYAYRVPITTPSGAGAADSGAWRIELTPAVYAAIHRPDLRDLEVFNADGIAVPFAPLAQTTAPDAAGASLPVLAVPEAHGNANGVLHLTIDHAGRARRVDLGAASGAAASPAARDWLLDGRAFPHPIERVALEWNAPAPGVIARFEVKTSHDLQDWQHVAAATLVALDHNGVRLERRELTLPGIRAPYLLLQRVDDGATLHDLSARAYAPPASGAPAPRWLDNLPGRAVAAPAPLAARFEYTLPAAMRFERARVELANDNALALLSLAGELQDSVPPAWRELARSSAFRLRAGEETIANGEVDLASAGRLRALRIDSATPLAAAPRLALAYVPDRFVFLAEGPPPFTLAVGSARTQRADYPIEVALAGLRLKLGKDWQPPLATLGANAVSAGAAVLQPVPRPIAWRRWLLWAVLVAGAAGVGALALSLLRQARAGPD